MNKKGLVNVVFDVKLIDGMILKKVIINSKGYVFVENL